MVRIKFAGDVAAAIGWQIARPGLKTEKKPKSGGIMPEDMGVPREQEKDFDASLSGGGTAADFWANRCDQLKEEIKTLRSDLSKREAEVARLTMGLQCVAREAEITGAKHLAASMAHLALWYAKDTAQAAQARDDKVAREAESKCWYSVANHADNLLRFINSESPDPKDQREISVLRSFYRHYKAKAEQGGK